MQKIGLCSPNIFRGSVAGRRLRPTLGKRRFWNEIFKHLGRPRKNNYSDNGVSGPTLSITANSAMKVSSVQHLNTARYMCLNTTLSLLEMPKYILSQWASVRRKIQRADIRPARCTLWITGKVLVDVVSARKIFPILYDFSKMMVCCYFPKKCQNRPLWQNSMHGPIELPQKTNVGRIGVLNICDLLYVRCLNNSPIDCGIA